MRLRSTTNVAGSDYRGLGVMVTMSTGQVITDLTSPEILLWDTEIYDDLAFHSTVSNTSRITVPAGVTRLQLFCCIHTEDLGATTHFKLIELVKNGSNTFDGAGAFQQRDIADITPRLPILTVLSVIEGDYFELQYSTTVTGAGETLQTDQNYFGAMVVL